MTPALRRAALAAVLGLAAALRFARLDRQGLLLFDEGQLILEARQTAALLAHGLRAAGGAPGEREALAGVIRSCSIIFARPVHTTLLAAVLLAVPGVRADQASLRLSAAMGTATVAAVWWLATTWYGEAAGLLAALLLAVAPYHLLYSREGLSDALAVTWWVLTLACAVRPGRGMAVLSGVAAGLCFGTNFRSLYLPLLVIPPLLRTGGPRRLGPWLGGFAAPLLACEALYRVAARLAQVPLSAFATGTYARQLGTLLLLHGRQEFLWKGFGAFPYYVWRWEGTGSLVLLLLVLAPQLTRWRKADAAFNTAWLIPWGLYSAYWDNASRFFVVLVPLVAILKARWIHEAARRLPWPPVAAGVLGLAAAGLTLPAVVPLIPRAAPYLAAAEFLATTGDPRHLSTNSRLGLAYFGPGSCVPVPATRAEVSAARRAGIRWAISDLQIMFGGFDHPDERLTTAAWIADHHATVLTVPYGGLALAQGVLEQDMIFSEARERLAALEAHEARLHVFDLAEPRKEIREGNKGQKGRTASARS